MSKQLTGKTAFITGASRGIGYAIAKKFAEQGANIVFTHLANLEQEHALESELRGLGVEVKAYHSDASDFNAVHEVIQATIDRFGGIDILVNNAGITRDHLLLRMDEQAWDEVIKVNLKSVFNTVKAATRTFIKQRSGSIINISSVVGIKGNTGQANYSASKAGIIGFTKSVALELASRNVRSNAIAPGFIQTAMTESLMETATQEWLKNIPLRRVGTPDDVANCALFLASDSSSYITGQVIQVDGGMLT
jgi:3-oxoacyl-[acyl-carrier protein] reductase